MFLGCTFFADLRLPISLSGFGPLGALCFFDMIAGNPSDANSVEKDEEFQPSSATCPMLLVVGVDGCPLPLPDQSVHVAV